MPNKIYINDTGTIISLDCETDITDATIAKILVLKPDNTEHEWIASVEDSRYIRYVIQSGDLNLSGEYFLQSYIETPSWNGRGETVILDVFDNFR